MTERPMVKTWVLSYSPKQEEQESLIAVHQTNCKLWPLIHRVNSVVLRHTVMCYVTLETQDMRQASVFHM